jgi:hypothetical protein
MKRVNQVKVFASESSVGKYLPVEFGTNKVVGKENIERIANANFKFGLESLEGDLQMKDLNSVLLYQGALLAYLYDKGVAEFSPYQHYDIGSVVSYGGHLWLAKEIVEPTAKEHEPDPCDPCKKSDCYNPVFPSKETGWCQLITSCEYDAAIQELKDRDAALQKAIDATKGVEAFAVLHNAETGALELRMDLSDGSKVTIPMTKFGHIKQNADGSITVTNADGSVIELPKYVAEQDLDQRKGFFFNVATRKWEVNLSNLVKEDAGLVTDQDGKLSVKPSDFIDNESLVVNPTGKTAVSEDWLNKAIKPIKDYVDDQKNVNTSALDKAIRDLEAAQKAYADEKAREAEVLARGNYAEIKAYKDNFEKLKQQVSKHENDLGNQTAQLKALGLTDEEILAMLKASLDKTNPRYITKLEPTENGVKVTYADGTTAFLNGNTVVTDGKSIVGNGKDTALSVQISKQPDNTIRVLDDGLYLGAHTEQSDYYVSTVSGNDENIGTRDKPMRTIQAVLDRVENTGSYINIYLHENEEFEWVYVRHTLLKVTFKAYGDTIDSQYPEQTVSNLYYRGFCAKNYPRPTINVRTRLKQFGNTPAVTRDSLICADISFQGMIINIWNKFEGEDNASYSGNFDAIASVTGFTDVHGCIVRLKTKAVPLTGVGAYRDDVVFRGNIRWIDSMIDGEAPWFASTNFTNQISLILWNSGTLQGYGEKPDHESLIPKDDYATAGKGIASHVVGAVINDTDKYVLGINFNYDVFTIK